MHIGKRGCRHSGGKRRGIQFVVRMQNQRHIEGAFGGRRGRFTIQHEQKICGVR